MRHHTWLSAFAIVLSVLTAGTGSAAAQGAPEAGPQAPPAIAARDTAMTASARRLERMARRLHGPSPLRTQEASRVDFAVRVSGDEPARSVAEPGDLAIGAPVYGAPTHDEMLTLMTPAPLRSTAPYRRFRPSVPLGR